MILVVDDDSALRGLLAERLKRSGYRALEAASGDDALELAEEQPPSLVVLEVNVSGRSGYAVCNELRHQLGNQLPVIFVSAERTEPFDRVAGLLMGADDYFTKPFDPDELVARIGRMLEQLKLRRPRSSGEAPFGLTPRETEVLGLLVEGLSQPEIAERLSLSPKTVGTHIQRIMGKMGVKSRTQAVAIAARDGFAEQVLRQARAHAERMSTGSA